MIILVVWIESRDVDLSNMRLLATISIFKSKNGGTSVRSKLWNKSLNQDTK